MGWSEKYKKSIDCDNPKGFSQRAHCQGRKKKMKEETLDYMSEGDFWHPDPEKDKKLSGKGPQMRAREDRGQSTSAQTKPDYSRRLKPGESYMDFAKRKQAERTRKEEKDHEYSMARSEISTIISAAKRLKKKMGKGEGNLEAWVQSKITKAADYIDSAADYVDSGEMKEESNGKCKVGYYYCYTDKECKPIPKGFKVVGHAGYLRKENGHSVDDDSSEDSNGNGNGNGASMGEEVVNEEGLRDWFGKSKSKDGKKGWVNVVTGDSCASDKPGEGIPKCVSSAKRASMSKKERLAAAASKRREDPGQQEKSGASKPTMVKTDRKVRKEEVEVTEAKDKPGKGSGKKDACYNKVKSRYSVWPSAYASGALVKCRKVGAANWGNKSESYDFSNWRDDFKALEIESIDLIKSDPLVKEESFDIDPKKHREQQRAKKIRDRTKTDDEGSEIAKKKVKGPALFGEGKNDPCWVGYKQVGMKKKGNKMVPNCVKEGEEINEIHSSAHTPHEVPSGPSGSLKKLVKKAVKRIDTDADGDTDHNDKAKGELGEFIPGVNNKRLFSTTRTKTAKENFSNWREDLGEDWQKVNKGDKTDGMSQKAVDVYRRENPGSKLKTAVTEKDPGPGRSKRRKSFCARSKGQQDMHNIDCSKDPDKAICKARRRWRC
jgi:hypothetical protein